jgi:hypothetical protein
MIFICFMIVNLPDLPEPGTDRVEQGTAAKQNGVGVIGIERL